MFLKSVLVMIVIIDTNVSMMSYEIGHILLLTQLFCYIDEDLRQLCEAINQKQIDTAWNLVQQQISFTKSCGSPPPPPPPPPPPITFPPSPPSSFSPPRPGQWLFIPLEIQSSSDWRMNLYYLISGMYEDQGDNRLTEPAYQFWKQHQNIQDGCCHTDSSYHITYLQQLAAFGDNFYNDLVLGLFDEQSELRKVVNNECTEVSTASFCAFKAIIPIVDMAAKLPASISQWTDEDERLKMRILIHILVLKRVYSNFFSTLQLNEGSILVDVTNEVLNLKQSDKLDELKAFNLLLLSAVSPVEDKLCSEKTADFCLFLRIIKEVDIYVEEARLDVQDNKIFGKRVISIYTGTNYDELLKQKELDRILEVIIEDRYTATEIANELKQEMANGFQGIKDYFSVVESYNSAIALADIGYINGRLDTFRDRINEISPELGDVGEVIKSAFIVAGADVAQGVVETILSMFSIFNPKKSILGGGSAGDVVNAMTDLELAISRVVKMDYVNKAFSDLKDETLTLKGKFELNDAFLINMKKLIDQNYTDDEFDLVKDIFLQQYSDYDPQVSREDLVGTQALWNALIEAACGVIDAADSVVGAGEKSRVEHEGYCINAPVNVERTFTVYGQIYDFQFELVTAMASYVRSLLAVHVTKGMDSTVFDELAGLNPDEDTTLATLSLMGGLSSMIYDVQMLKTVHLYCNWLEYEEAGIKPSECQGTKTDIALLLAHNIPSCNTQTHTFYYSVPTKPQSVGDTAYIDLDKLFAGEEVSFIIPNSEWMVNKGWIADHQKNYAFYVEQFEIYLPIIPQNSMRLFTIAASTQSNAISPGGTEYIITPPISITYQYKMAPYDAPCIKKQLLNPYTICANTGVKEICPESEVETEFRPSIYSLWNLKMVGGENLTPPNPASDLDLIIGLRICDKIPGSLLVQEQSGSSAEIQQLTCCPPGQYRFILGSQCLNCPANSTSALHGYYCEKN